MHAFTSSGGNNQTGETFQHTLVTKQMWLSTQQPEKGSWSWNRNHLFLCAVLHVPCSAVGKQEALCLHAESLMVETVIGRKGYSLGLGSMMFQVMTFFLKKTFHAVMLKHGRTKCNYLHQTHVFSADCFSSILKVCIFQSQALKAFFCLNSQNA